MKKILFLVFIILNCWTSIAQQWLIDNFTAQPIELGTSLTSLSPALSKTRTINVYLPASYSKDTFTSYPVIYLVDGSLDEDFINIARLVQFATFSWAQLIPESIVVGISNIDRKRDFTYPTKNSKDKIDFPTTGGSEKFITYLEKELQPFIAKEYRVSDERMLIGQSLGGLLETEILWPKSHLFSKYVIVSPSLWWDDNSLLSRKRTPLKIGTKVFVAIGQKGPIMEGAGLGLAASLISDINIQNLL
ncbi:MAG: putative alpha/beta superfamily hydrolase [Flavobacteriales bacterium]|jgi:predicted alpha/beta superfamily hydrolase